MLPMGTIVAVCMFVGVVFALRIPLIERLPGPVKKAAGFIVLAAGMWNVFWYAITHIGEFWGFSALVSGVLLIVSGLFIIGKPRLPDWLLNLKVPVLVLLFFYGLLYAITIIRI